MHCLSVAAAPRPQAQSEAKVSDEREGEREVESLGESTASGLRPLCSTMMAMPVGSLAW